MVTGFLGDRAAQRRTVSVAGVAPTIPSIVATISELNRPDDLRVLLTALRHLKSIEIREGVEPRHIGP
jgi:hypothetical protein